jgi:type IV pilus assembly protein PilC
VINKLKNFDIRRKPAAAPKVETKEYAPREKTGKMKLPSFSMPKMNFSSLKFTSFSAALSSPRKFSVKKQTFFAKRLSFLIKSGLPMLESMHIIQKQTKNKSEIKIFDRIISDVANGQSLATSLAKFKGVFGNFAINIIKAGESSGTLTSNLSYLADELKKKELLRKKIMGSLLYPIIITVATFGITGFLTVYIFPKIMPIFQSLKAELPFSTRFLIWLSQVVRNYGLYIFLVLVFLILAIALAVKYSSKVKFIFHGLILRIPIAGPIAKNYNLTNTMRTMGLLLKSGISLTESLIVTRDTTENVQYKKAFDDISHGVMKGKNISQLIVAHPKIFPEMLGHMIAIGERSGNLSNTLIYLSEYYENEFDDQTKNLSSSIEPVLMIIMGVMVGFIAISIISPIYGITQSLHK